MGQTERRFRIDQSWREGNRLLPGHQHRQHRLHLDQSWKTERAVCGTARPPPAAGLHFNPDSDLLLPVTFTPTRKGKFTTEYTLHSMSGGTSWACIR